MPKYIPLLRPAGFATLPSGLSWDYVEAPHYVTRRPDLPTSKHPHGIIECRELTADEAERFDLRNTGDQLMPNPLKQHEKDRVPVYDRTGRIITTVHKTAQSVGAARAAKATACEWTFRFGIAGWVVKP